MSKRSDTEAAARDLADEIRSKLDTDSIDLVCLFFSAHHASKSELLAAMIRQSLHPRMMVGCSGEGVIAGAEELETAPAVPGQSPTLSSSNSSQRTRRFCSGLSAPLP
ncbi:MAG: hypothetical protein HP492_07190 [Nitrospira sp.]|nr:hypothetical protein [Nitrospira sp.]